jgi:hypothetical protein
MKKRTLLIVLILCVVAIFIVFALFPEAYCSTKAGIMTRNDGQSVIEVPATGADLKQAPGLSLKSGQKISHQLSEELRCERNLKKFIFF